MEAANTTMPKPSVQCRVREMAELRLKCAAQDIHDKDLCIQAAAILYMFSRQAYTRSYLPK